MNYRETRAQIRWAEPWDLTEQEAADVLGISRVTLWRRHRDGKAPPHVMTPRGPRYMRAQLLAWALENDEGVNP